MKVDWIEWAGRGMQLGLAVLVVGALYGWTQQQSAEQDAMCDIALSYVEVLDAKAMAAAAGVSVERYAEVEYAVAMSGSAAKVDKWNALWSEWYDRIPADARREIRNAQAVADDAWAEPEYTDY